MPVTLDAHMQTALDRLAAIGATPSDQRNAVAVLALIGAGLDPRRLATSRNARDLSEQLGLDIAGWGRTMELLARAGIIGFGLART